MLRKGTIVNYLMESPCEGDRLEAKTKDDQVERQVKWAGISEGMRVLDAGCGAGKTTAVIQSVVGDTGHVVGLDMSQSRIQRAEEKFGRGGISFIQHDLTQPYLADDLFDAVWIRFLLEYFRVGQLNIVRNAIQSLKPGGILVLADLDHNCLNHYGHSERLDKTFQAVATSLERYRNFDPYAGRKLYAHLFDLGFTDIAMTVEAHHLYYGLMDPTETDNWLTKAEVAVKHSGDDFNEFEGGYQEALEEFKAYFFSPRRFIYTPIILAKGHKPN